MKKVLYKSEPILTSYSTLGNITSVLNHNVEFEPWLYNNFIQLSVTKLFRFAYQKQMYYDCPYITRYSIPDYLVRKIPEFIIQSIQMNQYLFFLIDRFYISSYSEYQRQHLVHEIFVYGYDDEKKVFYTSDNSQNGKYVDSEISFEDLTSARENVKPNFMYLSEINRQGASYIDMDKIRYMATCYIHSKANYFDIRYTPGSIFGVKVFKEYIQRLSTDHKLMGDYRPLHLFWEHKELMLRRISYLMEKGFIEKEDRYLSEYEKLARQFLLLRNKQIRYALTRDPSIIRDIEVKIPGYVDRELELLQEIFKV